MNKIKPIPAYKEYFTGQSLIYPSDCVKDLGLLVDYQLNWENHISNLCKQGRRLSGWILSVFFNRDAMVMLTLFNAIVRSRLEYCCQIWNPVKINEINALEQIQRSFTQKIQSVGSCDYWERITKLKIMSLQRRREMSIILYVWKIKYDRVPNDIQLLFRENNRKSSMTAIVKPMPKVKGKLLTQYENSFVIRAAKLWNKIPCKLTAVDNLIVFKKRLDEYLRLYPDKPPIDGHYHVNSNSLLDYRTIGL